jgi:hypothetical protein
MLLDKNVGVAIRSHVIWDLVRHLDVSDEFGVLPCKVADVIALSGRAIFLVSSGWAVKQPPDWSMNLAAPTGFTRT